MSDFVHLHVHSHYSLLDSTVKVKDLVSRVTELGMDAVAITDHGNLHACIELQSAAKGAGVRPIFGIEAYVVPDVAEAAGARPYHLVLLAETLEGYRNLVRLNSHAWLRGPDTDGRPLVDYAELRRHSEGVIALSGDMGGEVPQLLLRGDMAHATEAAERYQSIFGADSFFLEVQRTPGIELQQRCCELLVELGERAGIPCVATNNVHYLRDGDHGAHAVLMCVGMDKRIDRSVIERIPLTTLYLRSPAEMAELFADLPEAVANTRRIADRCDVTIPTGMNYLPSFDVPDGYDEAGYLRELARQGLQERFDALAAVGRDVDRDAYRARLELELDIIVDMGFPGYFLIVQDFIRWAKRNDIPVGPGRGSGAGSIVAWSLSITDIDPIPYGLLFERFLNPERVSMPDFDIDFCQSRRGEVIDYVTHRYGVHNVGQIVTFGQLKAKAVVRDVARVLNLSYADADRLAKLVPNELNIKLADAYAREPKLREAVAEDDTIEFLYHTGLALEGNNRGTGIHAAGVVISGEPLWEYVPILVGGNGEIVAQYAKNEVEDAGLVKFDFLGLKTLTVIEDAVRLVNQTLPDGETVDFDRVPLDDAATYDAIKSGDTTGVFQMESDGFQRLSRRLKPDCFEDIVAAVALYRPGPLGSGMVEQFIECKHGRQVVTYPHPWLEDVLRETYGVMVYQEQVMQVAQILAGYTLGGADLLRRAMGKKKPSEMDRQRAIFVEGCGKNDISEAKANEVFDLMAHFAGYGFNKSHSAAYALLTFRTAWLKAHHPTAFYAALMTNDASSTDKVVKYITDARSRGIAVLPPDVNASDASFSVAEGAIRFGLGAVKGVGSGAIEAIVEARESQAFTSLYDFCERVDLKRCNRRVVEALVRCGAFDTLYPDADDATDAPSLTRIGRWRARMLAVVDAAFERGQQAQRDRESGQSSLFGMFAEVQQAAVPVESYPEVRGWDARTVLQFEKKTLGFYVSGHPLDRYRDEIGRFTDLDSRGLAEADNRTKVRMAAVIAAWREQPLKSGEGRMAFLQLEDHFGEYEGIVYARVYDEVAELLDSDEALLVTGTVRIEQVDDASVRKVAVDCLTLLSDTRSASFSTVVLRVAPERVDEALLDRLQEVFAAHPGRCALTLKMDFGTADAEIALEGVEPVDPSDAFLHEVFDVLGDQSVRFR